jgi:N-acetylglucosamine kinase-like BadF-type ATPase
MLMEEIGIATPDEFVGFIYRKDMKKNEIAALAKVVDQAHKKVDNKAKEILIDAAGQLFLLTKAAVRGIKAEQDAIMVVVSGSVLINNFLVYEEFVRLLTGEYPNVIVQKAKADASRGAVIVALNSIKLI